MWFYPIPTRDGRWAAAYSVPGSDRWTTFVDCPTEQVARQECERLNAGRQAPPAPRLASDWLPMPEVMQ